MRSSRAGGQRGQHLAAAGICSCFFSPLGLQQGAHLACHCPLSTGGTNEAGKPSLAGLMGGSCLTSRDGPPDTRFSWEDLEEGKCWKL